MKSIATVGYEGTSPEDFDATLKEAGVELVVDVRALALSRRPGFSKTTLSDRLQRHGFDYIHMRDLGDPKPGREAARAGNMSLFRKIYSAHLRTVEALESLKTLQILATERRVALLCFEADAATCHRAMIANLVAKSGKLSIVHLKVERGQPSNRVRDRADHHSREGLAAA